MPQTIDNLLATWSNSLTTYSAFKFNVIDNASAAGSLLMDLQVGGSSRFNVLKSGYIRIPAAAAAGGSVLSSAKGIATSAGNGIYFGSDWAGFQVGGGGIFAFTDVQFVAGSTSSIGFSSNTYPGFSAISQDLFLTRRAAANLRLGAADAAAPVAQTLSVQSVVAGTTNTAGANLTITGSQGTGTGAGGSIIFQVAPAGSSGSAQNSLTTAMTINANKSVIFTDYILSPVIYSNNGMTNFTARSLYVSIGANVPFGFAPTNNADAAPDVNLARDAANTLALRNGAAAQSFRVYNTTDGTNSEFGSIRWSSNMLLIGVEATGTGATNRTTELSGGAVHLKNTNSGNAMRFQFGAGDSIYFETNGVVRLNNNSGHLKFGTSNDAGVVRADASVLRVSDGSTGGGALQLTEMTAPAAPATNNVRIYAEDNGSGKTRLMALFPTGAAVQIAIEP